MSSGATSVVPEILEICCSTLSEVQIACEKGAHRIELCSGMEFDGLTPSLDLIKDTIIICSQHGVKLVCMLRCRGGNFIYTPLEMDNMLNTLSIWKREGLNLDGVVFGALSKSNPSSPDINAVSRVVSCSAPWPVTFHKAIDYVSIDTKNITTAAIRVIDELYECGVRRILTSGLHVTAEEGKDVLRDMQKHVKMMNINMSIVMAGGIRRHNIRPLVEYTGITQIHSRSVGILEERFC